MVEKYEYFLKIAEFGNISKAAENLYISQPSLTKYLQRLEASLDVELFNRKEKPLKLTYAGQLFYEYVLLEQSGKQKLADQFKEIKNKGRDKICIGMPLWRSSVLLPGFLKLFTWRHPLVSVELHEGSARQLEGEIMNDSLDFVLVNLPINYANISYEHLFTENILLIGSKNDAYLQELVQKSPLSGACYHADIEDFKDSNFIMAQRSQHITMFVENMLSQRRLNINTIIRTQNVTLAVNMAAEGLGYTFVPECGTTSEFFPCEKVYRFTLNKPMFTCEFAAAYKKDKYISHACHMFIDEFKQYCMALAGRP